MKKKFITIALAAICLLTSGCSTSLQNGAPGQDGKSAYETWLEAGNEGTENDFLAWLKGDKGEKGEQGTQGEQGEKGDKGDQGDKGEDGKSAYELYCEKYNYNGTESQWLSDLLNGTLSQKEAVKPDLTISVLGASSSTKQDRNAVEITVTEKDVGVELSAYPTYHDIGTKIGSHTITESDIGNELTFTPTSSDIGTVIGTPKNHNSEGVKVWWEHVEDYFNCTVNPVCWSGSSYSSIREDNVEYKTSYGWHDAQIRKLGIRVEGSMERVAPDIVILHRGINDMTKEPYARLTEGFFDDPQWKYPTTDKLSGGTYGIKEALSLTIKKIRAAYPTTKIVLSSITTMQRVNYGDFPTNNGYYTFAQLNNAIREVADFFGCQMIDFDKCGITYENGVTEGYLKDDRTHPTEKGHSLIGKQAINDLLYKVHLDINDYIPTTKTFETWQLLEGYGVKANDGGIVVNKSYYTYDFIPVDAYSTYCAKKCRSVAVLDKDGYIIKIVDTEDFKANGYKIQIPKNGVYLRICAKYNDLPLANFKFEKV